MESKPLLVIRPAINNLLASWLILLQRFLSVDFFIISRIGYNLCQEIESYCCVKRAEADLALEW